MDTYRLDTDDVIDLDDVRLAASLGRSREQIAQRNRLIWRCYEQGNYTNAEIAVAANLTPQRVGRIVKQEYAARAPKPERPRLRLVR
jgi:hypothetical protein